jgi:two-component system chemotaxis sensor kinase CheA
VGNDFNKRLLATFAAETDERLAVITASLIELEKTAAPEKRREILEAVFREAHSLKGAARAVSMDGIESLCHALENVFSALKRETGAIPPALFDLLHQAADAIGRHSLTPEADRGPAEKSRSREIVLSLGRYAKGGATPVSLPPQEASREDDTLPGKPAVAETVRIPAGKLDDLFHQAEEMLAAKMAGRQRSAELAELRASLAQWEKEWDKLRPVMRSLHKSSQAEAGQGFPLPDAGNLGKLLTFFEWSHACIKSVQNKAHGLAINTESDRYALTGMVDNLLDDMKKALMLPCATILEVLPKMVRDLARARGKEAELVIRGETVEIDKRVLEEMKDPLIHLVRNCIDHGIEKPEERKRGNKPAHGAITVQITLIDSGRIEIVVADDGAGLDTGRLTATAVQRGVITEEEAGRMEETDLLQLVFRSGFSTSPMITDISGRGLGLAIVKEKAEKMGGSVSVASEPHKGATFRLVLPLTLSTFRGVVVTAGEQSFIVPALAVEKVARIDSAALKTVENRETVELEGTAVSFVRLADLLQLPRKEGRDEAAGHIQLFVLGSGPGRIAFGVDTVVDAQEILVKSLGPQLSRVRNIAGAAVLAQGKVVTILHPGDLLISAGKGVAAAAVFGQPADTADRVRKAVLVVEDSITARSLLKNILETAGYRVVTALDGIDALTQLRTADIDLVVSDVDMPRMNGFDLTAKIRASREFADLPVVLVTSLDSREDKERGIEVGANAYVVKSSFDQSNLLEFVKRLI